MEGASEHSKGALFASAFLNTSIRSGASGSDCKVEGEITLSVASLKGKAEG